jgi:hypothetical protein
MKRAGSCRKTGKALSKRGTSGNDDEADVSRPVTT